MHISTHLARISWMRMSTHLSHILLWGIKRGGAVCAGDGQSRRPCDTGVRRGPSPLSVGCGTKLTPRDDQLGRWATFVPRG